MHPPVLSFTAYSGTGKTTYLEKLIPCLKALGLKVAIIKHDGHDFEADIKGKDSWRFAQAGADIVAIASSKKLALFQYWPSDIDDIINHISGVDLIIIEGNKHGPYPKIALFRSSSGNGLSVSPAECFAIVGDYPYTASCPIFPLEDPKPLASYLLHMIQTGELLKRFPL